MPRYLMGTYFGPCYGGPCYGAYKDGKTPAEVHALDKFHPHFLPGDVIAPKNRDCEDFDHKIYVVIEMIGNETSVSFKPFGAKIWAKNSISSMEYDLATEEEIARVVARKLNEPPEQLPTVDNVLKMLQSKMISVDEAKRFLGFA